MTPGAQLLEHYWFGELGCRPEDLQEGKVKVTAHGTLAGYAGAMAFRQNNACIISVPRQMVEDIAKKASGIACEEAFKTSYLEKLFGASVERTIGPAWLAQIEPEQFKPCHGPDSKELTEADRPAFKRFLQGCSATDLELSVRESVNAPTVGVFIGDEIVAAARYEIHGGIISHISVLTRPDHRGGGYAKKAVSHITSVAFTKNVGIQYRTLQSNAPSVALAKGLGYSDFAETIAVRFKIG